MKKTSPCRVRLQLANTPELYKTFTRDTLMYLVHLVHKGHIVPYIRITHHTSPITYYIISYILSQLSRITLHTSHILCECIARINTENLALGTLERRANNFIIQCIFSSFSLVGSPSRDLQITQCLQIIVCSCAIPSKCVLLQITFFSFIMGTTPLCKKWQTPENCFNNLGARMIKQLFNSDSPKNIMIWQCLRDQLFA